MLKNYLQSAFRFYKYNKIFTVINLIGLSIALSISFIIVLFVINELSYDHSHKNRERIFRVLNYITVFKYFDTQTPLILAPALKEEFSQIEKAIRVIGLYDFKLKVKDEFIDISNVIATDSEVFDIFTLPLVPGGSNQKLLDDQNSLVLSQKLAAKLFKDQNPVGKEIMGIVHNQKCIFTVKGVFENLPENSTFRAQCFVNIKWAVNDSNKYERTWRRNYWNTWILLSKDCNAKSLEKQFGAFEKKNLGQNPDNHYSLQNLSDVYLGSEYISNSRIIGNIKNIRLFSAIALLIVLVATINYIILSTAVSSGRVKEIGIRKTFGAVNNNIRSQLFSESILLTIIVLPIAFLLMRLFIPYAGKLFQTELHIMSSNILVYILVYLLLTILIGIVSGIYTSAYLSRLKVIDILRNTMFLGKRKHIVRFSLIIIQLVIFCSFVTGTLIIRSQYKYALEKDLGYYSKDILIIDLGDFKGYSTYINNIKSNPNVISAGAAMVSIPMQGYLKFLLPNYMNKEAIVQVEGMTVGFNFLKTMGINIIAGRDFSEEYGSDISHSAILNETAVKQLDIPDPVGKQIGDHTIIGVVKDFNLHSIHSSIPPLEINLTDNEISQVAIHFKPGTLNSILPMLEAEWKKAAPDKLFSYRTIEDLIKDLYSSEKNLTNIVTMFALLTLVIAAFGLFGLTLFVGKTRTKEIGLKKVFGSSERKIVYSFLIENLVLTILAWLISMPVTIYFMSRWLNNFAYKVPITPWIFVITFIIAEAVVLITVYFHSYKSSRLNPIQALRYA
jgi:putative ABC transport system permease protein